MRLKWLSSAGYLVMVLAMVWLFMVQAFLASGMTTIVVQFMALTLMLWARLTFGLNSFHLLANPTAGNLVISGPYRFLRHPIYASILYFLWAGIASHLSGVSIMLAIVATAGAIVRIVTEEHLLLKHYSEYATYAGQTKRLIPYIF